MVTTEVSFADLLAQLPEPNSAEPAGTFRVQSIPSSPEYFIGRDFEGRACLLLSDSADHFQAPVRLAAIEGHFGVTCRISASGSPSRDEVMTVITCTAPEVQFQNYFLHVCEIIMRIVGPNPTQCRMVEVVERLIALFQRVTRPSSRSLTGLIGELFVISKSRDARQAVRAWRSAVDNKFDFAVDDIRLEVKASSERSRVHHLSAEQCRPSPGTVGLLASLFIERTGGGTSVLELLRSIERRLSASNELVLKLQETVAETLGQALLVGLETRFDEQLARNSLKFYDLELVPAIRESIPAEVSQVRFCSDLSLTPTLAASTLKCLGVQTISILPPI